MTQDDVPDQATDLHTEGQPEHSLSLRHVRTLFADNVAMLGPIESPTKLGFLALAKEGAQTWNAWREEYPEPIADFSHVHFSEHEWIDFSRFRFSSSKRIKRRRSVDFKHSVFSEYARFTGAEFGRGADFSDALFLKTANFLNSTFHPGAKFNGTVFGQKANFSGCNLGLGASFHGTEFQDDCLFTSAIIQDRASFNGSTFTGDVDFSSSSNVAADVGRKSFKSLSFRGCTFKGGVDFSNRQFQSKTDFSETDTDIFIAKSLATDAPARVIRAGTPVVFENSPKFHGCKLHQDTSFDHAVFSALPSPEAARAYRTLKLAMEQLKATRDEQRFFKLEMKAEKPGLKGWKWLVSSTYEALSDYGFSLRRPLACWLLASILFGGAHGVMVNKAGGANWMAALTPHPGNLWSTQTQAAFQYVAINAIPVPGLDRKSSALRDSLFAPKGAPGWIASVAILLEMLHKAVTLLCLLLIGLSIRNLLKMKS